MVTLALALAIVFALPYSDQIPSRALLLGPLALIVCLTLAQALARPIAVRLPRRPSLSVRPVRLSSAIVALLALGVVTVALAGLAWRYPKGVAAAAPPVIIVTAGELKQAQTHSFRGSYVAAGVALRNRGTGTIALTGLPTFSDEPGAPAVVSAYLYWNVLAGATADPRHAQGKLNGQEITGTMIGTGRDACWGQRANYSYRADVSGLITGNGDYALSDFATGETNGRDPHAFPVPTAPLIEGASLVVIYQDYSAEWSQIVLYDGSVPIVYWPAYQTLSGYVAPNTVTAARTTFIGADGQRFRDGFAFDGGQGGFQVFGLSEFEGRDAQGGPDFAFGNLWDTRTYDVTGRIAPRSTGSRAAIGASGDCLIWVAQVLEIRGGTPNLAWDPPAIDFGDMPRGVFSEARKRTTTFTITGDVPLPIETNGANGNALWQPYPDCLNQTFRPGESCAVGINVRVGSLGARQGRLSLNTGTAGYPDIFPTVSLTANGVPPAPAISFSPNGLIFYNAKAGVTSSPTPLTVTNSGNIPLNISSITIAGPQAGDFQRVSDSCLGVPIAPGSSCEVRVSFTPAQPNLRTAKLTLTTDIPGGEQQTVALSGTPITMALQHQRYPDNVYVDLPKNRVVSGLTTRPGCFNGASQQISCTHDGNQIKILASFQNPTTGPLNATVRFVVVEPGGAETEIGTQGGSDIPVNGARSAVFVWDSDGWAYRHGPAPDSTAPLTIKAELRAGSTIYATQTQEVLILPKPTILVHGWNGLPDTWNSYKGPDGFLKELHPHAEGFAVGDRQDIDLTNRTWCGPIPGVVDDPGRCQMNTGKLGTPKTLTIAENVPIMANYIEAIRTATNAWHVDLVVHSMGGLFSRKYIQDHMPASLDQYPTVRRLVMLATPNLGSFCADAMVWIGREDAPTQPLLGELTVTWVNKEFNARVLSTRGALLYGRGTTVIPQPECVAPTGDPLKQFGDGVVPGWSLLADGVISWEEIQGDSTKLHSQFTTSHDDFVAIVKPALSGTIAALTTQVTEPPVEPDGAFGLPTPLGTPAAVSPLQGLVADVRPLPAGATSEVSFAIPTVTAFGVVFVAPESVTATLLDPSGAVIGTSAAGSPESAQLFRGFARQYPVRGTYTVRFVNTGTDATDIPFSVWIDGSPLTLALTLGNPTDDGRVAITALLRDGGVSVPGATVTARIVAKNAGTVQTVTLTDSGDGSYSLTSAPLPPDEYTVVVRAEVSGTQRLVMGMVKVEEPLPSLVTRPAYTLQIDSTTGGRVAANTGAASYGPNTVVTLGALPDPGYRFTGWIVDGNPAGEIDPLVLVMNANHTIAATFVLANHPPVVTAGANQTADEGTTVQVSANFTDADANTHTCTIDWGDGTASQGSVTAPTATVPGRCTGSHAYADNRPGGIAYSVIIAVTDSGSPPVRSTATLTATIRNIAPTATFVAPGTVLLTSTFTLALTNPADIAADRPTLQYAFDCGDGAGYGPFGGAASRQCPAPLVGVLRTVRGAVRDKDGGLTEYTATVILLAGLPLEPSPPPLIGGDGHHGAVR